MDSDGFTIVNRKSRRQKPMKISTRGENAGFNYNIRAVSCNKTSARKEHVVKTISLGDLKDDINHKLKILRGSDFYSQFQKLVKSLYTPIAHKTQPSKSILECPQYKIQNRITIIVSFGIGSIASSNISKFQFAFLLLIAELFEVNNSNIHIFDPVFTPLDRDFIESLKLKILPENKKGRSPVDTPTLFFMPHCPKALYNNLVVSNWTRESLEKIVIIGNSFESCFTRSTRASLEQSFPALLELVQSTDDNSSTTKTSKVAGKSSGGTFRHFVEYGLPTNFNEANAFNDTSLIYFPKDRIITSLSLNENIESVDSYIRFIDIADEVL
ncbi:hypothetical protein BKA69DRAFT_1050253 [Paraphysoderma sedebokerense]|nr:hypothetical protein BKA69DRAFT_1050253 [Paraphysoderma sedebokerense]